LEGFGVQGGHHIIKAGEVGLKDPADISGLSGSNFVESVKGKSSRHRVPAAPYEDRLQVS